MAVDRRAESYDHADRGDQSHVPWSGDSHRRLYCDVGRDHDSASHLRRSYLQQGGKDFCRHGLRERPPLSLMHPIIEVENLSKRYRLGQFNAQTMREEVEQFFARFRNKRAKKGGELSGESSELW